ncbi:MAG: DHH family phosphoesterase [Candidatus Absconditabacteria bacterium]|nr:DHH family phosphoesterase [Candidatus Absconditabacteria bacterium]
MFGHKNPDGDCIGSLLGLGKLLEKMGKNVKYFTPTLPSRIYDFLPETKKISSNFDYGKYDLLVFVDFSEYTRISSFYDFDKDYFDNHNIIVIDHHVYEHKYKNWKVISDPTAMSACEIIFEHTYKRWPKLYDKNIATYFYLGLTTDSGNFRYDEDHKRVLGNALKLIELGADKKNIVNNAFRKKSFAGVKMMQLIFKRLKKKGGLIYTRYTEKDLKKIGIDREEADFGQVIIQDIAEAKVTVIFRDDKENNHCYMSFRSKDADVQRLAKSFGGGGHIHAAGCNVSRKGTFQQQVEELSNKITKMI